MWQQSRYDDRQPDGSRYQVEITAAGKWVAHYVQTGGRKALPIKQVDGAGNKHDFATAFEAMVACDLHRRGVSIEDAMEMAS